MTELEQKIKAKIPGEDTGITVRQTLCDICTPGFHCGVDAYVREGRVVKVEGTKDHPVNRGLLCTKGLANREYLYRSDRIMTPLRRVGERGEGKFQPIDWEEAYGEIARRLTGVRAEEGADAVAFFSGYGKWYRSYLRRFAHVFGTQNYGTESSTCFSSGLMAWLMSTGMPAGPQFAGADLLLAWAYNGYYARYTMAPIIEERKRAGMKVIVVDPRITPAVQKVADLHLRPRLGTDGALALAIANALIQRSWVDHNFIERHVHGFAQYAEYARGFHEGNVERLTGVPYGDVVKAAEMIHASKAVSMTESSTLGHHRGGMQNYRAITSLLLITGNYDRPGTQSGTRHTYMENACGFETREHAFMEERRPQGAKPPVGADRFPLWYHCFGDMQCCDLSRQILDGTPYPIRAVFALGMNLRMFPGSGRMREALNALDFFVDTDLFLTDTAKLADIVLPACTSLERGEFKTYPGGFAWYTTPVVEPLGQSKPDTLILQELAREMGMEDPLLLGGYEACIRDMTADLDLTVEKLRASDTPVRVKEFQPPQPGKLLEAGLPTPTGKIELYAEVIAAHPEWGLDPLPTYTPPAEGRDGEDWTMCAGARIPHALHSRLHDVSWLRSVRPEPLVELAAEDADKLGIAEGDTVEISTSKGAIRMKAAPSGAVLPGEIFLYHGYREADANSLLDPDNLDPYSGFPAYRSARCRIRKVVE